jgi:methyl-accepting chemotaxis protein
MSSLNELSTKAKLKLGFGVIITSILILVIVSFFIVSKLNNLHNDMISVEHLTIDVIQFHSDENTIEGLSYELLLEKTAFGRDSVIRIINAGTTKLESSINQIDSLLNGLPEQKQLFKSIRTNSSQYIANRKEYLAYVSQGKIQEAHDFIERVQNPLNEDIERDMLQLTQSLDRISVNNLKNYQSLSRTINISLSIIGLCVIVVSVIIALFTLNMLKKISYEIKNGVNVLGTSASEILTTVTEISTGAAETATAVSETTTTVEEVRQTSMVSNKRAQSLIFSSEKATDSVDKGRESINEVIVSMKKIDNQMNLISETVMKLADQNHAIGEITSSVADIADQSNLLAVNAAIEAVKAGEHGRGFTAVAQEIRSLADQSKKATAQVKEILNEINKSVNHAVGVTERSSQTVDEGIKLVTQSGEVIELLAKNVEEAAEASLQISSSNQQQMAGMDQIVPQWKILSSQVNRMLPELNKPS